MTPAADVQTTNAPDANASVANVSDSSAPDATAPAVPDGTAPVSTGPTATAPPVPGSTAPVSNGPTATAPADAPVGEAAPPVTESLPGEPASAADLASCPRGDAAWVAALRHASRTNSFEELLSRAKVLAAAHPDRWEPRWLTAECFYRTGRVPDAARVGAEALELASTQQDPVGIALSAYRCGWLAFRAGELGAGARHYGVALEAAETTGRKELLAQIQSGLAGLLVEMGRYGEAHRLMERSAATLKELGLAPFARRTELNRAVILMLLGDALSAHRVLEDVYHESEASGDSFVLSRAALTLGNLQRRLGKEREALEWYARVPAEDAELASLASLSRGLISTRLGNYGEAESHFDQAARDASPVDRLLIEAHRAEIDIARGQARSALSRLGKVISRAGTMHAENVGWIARWLAGRAWLSEGHWEKAAGVLEDAVAILEGQSTELDPMEEGLRFLRERSDVYSDLAAARCGAGVNNAADPRAQEALDAVEATHARALRQMLSAGGPRSGEASAESPHPGETSAESPHAGTASAEGPRSGAAGAENLHSGETSAESPHAGTASAEGPRSGAAGAERPYPGEASAVSPHAGKASAEGPRSGAAGAESPHPGEASAENPRLGVASVQVLQEGLAEGELLVDFAIGRERGVVVAIRRDAFAARQIAGWDELAEPLRRYRSALIRPLRSAEARLDPELDLARSIDEGWRLSHELLDPLRPILAEATRLYVVPDRELALLPFAALPWDRASVEGKDGVRFLGELLETAVMPLAGRPAHAPSQQGGVLLAGDPLEGPTAALPRLPLAGYEIESLERIWGHPRATLLRGPALHLDRLRRELAGVGTLHLATHAEASTSDPARCAVFLSGGEALGLDAIRRLPLERALVVLSACNSGRGELVPGEGVIGLSWAFLEAGAETVAVSLWQVEDRSAAELMIAFHRFLAAGDDPLRAMSRARRERARVRRHPAFWAPFVMISKPR